MKNVFSRNFEVRLGSISFHFVQVINLVIVSLYIQYMFNLYKNLYYKNLFCISCIFRYEKRNPMTQMFFLETLRLG